MSRKPVKPKTTAGKCLRALREKAGLTQVELASQMGLSPNRGQAYIGKLEVGPDDPVFLAVVRFIRACGVKWEDFCALYDPPPNPRVDTREIDKSSLTPADKRTLKQRLKQQVYRYESRTARWPKGKPMAPVVQKRAQGRFEKYRRQYGIVEMAARRFLEQQAFPVTELFAWLDITQRIFSVLRGYPEPEWATRLEQIAKLVEERKMNRLILERLKEVVVVQFAGLTQVR
jgi:transcriptional regulator with XRE-family HTH domain